MVATAAAARRRLSTALATAHLSTCADVVVPVNRCDLSAALTSRLTVRCALTLTLLTLTLTLTLALALPPPPHCADRALPHLHASSELRSLRSPPSFPYTHTRRAAALWRSTLAFSSTFHESDSLRAQVYLSQAVRVSVPSPAGGGIGIGKMERTG